MKQVTYSREAIRTLTRRPRNTAVHIREKVAAYAADPQSQANDVKRLQGTDQPWLRVDDWRFVLRETTVIAVIRVALRGGA